MKELKKSKLLIISIIAIVLIIITILVGIKINNSKSKITQEDNQEEEKVDYVKEVEDGIKLNRSSKLNEDKKIGNLKISNPQLTSKGGMTTLLANVINEGSSKTNIKVVGVNLLDESGETLISLTGVIEALEPGGETQLNISMTSDYIEAYDFSIFEK